MSRLKSPLFRGLRCAVTVAVASFSVACATPSGTADATGDTSMSCTVSQPLSVSCALRLGHETCSDQQPCEPGSATDPEATLAADRELRFVVDTALGGAAESETLGPLVFEGTLYDYKGGPFAGSGLSVVVRGQTASGLWPLLVTYYSFGTGSVCPYADPAGFTGVVFVAHQEGQAVLQYSCRID
jgi:hypothetical protein